MDIRFANTGDIPGLIALLLQVGKVHHDLRPDIFRPVTQKYDEAALTELLKDEKRPVFVAMDGDFVSGYCFCILREYQNSGTVVDHKDFYIDDLCVDENRRGMHIGSRLYDHVVEYARESGCYNVTLNVWTLNPGAMRFYEKCGLVPQKVGMEKIL